RRGDVLYAFEIARLCALVRDVAVNRVPGVFLTVAPEFAVKIYAPGLHRIWREAQARIRDLDFGDPARIGNLHRAFPYRIPTVIFAFAVCEHAIHLYIGSAHKEPEILLAVV